MTAPKHVANSDRTRRKHDMGKRGRGREGGKRGKRKDKEEGRTLGRLLTVFGYSETLDSIDREKSR